MSRRPTIWPSQAQALEHMQPGDDLRCIGRTWIITPAGEDPRRVIGQLVRVAVPTPPRARTSDPSTSHRAGAPDRNTDRDRAYRILLHHGPLTDDALAELMDRRPTSAGKRRKELVDLGLVEPTGERRPTRTGSPAIVWRAIEAAS